MPETILVTGATGFVAKHVVRVLLDRGYRVRGSMRRASGEAAVRAEVGPALADPASMERFEPAILDLGADAGWEAAMQGAAGVIHVASPFPLVQPKDPAEVVRPAVEGTRRMLAAARRAGVGRVVLTSSSGAVTSKAAPDDGRAFAEADWSDLSYRTTTPYFRSKILAERAAWDEARGLPLAVVLPGFVLGPALDADISTSLQVVQRLMRGKDPMVPRVGFPVCDVRDVALAHVSALERDEAIGQRHLIVDRFVWFAEMGRLLKAEFPDRQIPTRTAPDLLIRGLGLFDPALRTILPSLGRTEPVDASASLARLDMALRPADEAIVEGGRSLERTGAV